MCGWVTLLYNRNYHTLEINYTSIKLKIIIIIIIFKKKTPMHTQWTHPYSPLKKLELGTTCLGDQRPSWDHGGGRGCVEGSPTYLAWVPTTWAMKSEHKVLIEGAPILLESRGQMSRGMGVGHGGG